MTRLLYLPDDATVIQLEVDLPPAQLVAAVNAGMRPLPILRNAPPGTLSASQVNNSVIVAPARAPGRPTGKVLHPDITRRQGQVLELSSRGFTTNEIAAMLDISRRAVNYHLNQLKQRMRGEHTQKLKTYVEEEENEA